MAYQDISKKKKIFFLFLLVIFLHIFIYDEKLDYKNKPNFHGKFSGQLFNSVEINVNSLGFRDYEFDLEKTPDIYRIMVVGDSITFGAGVELEDTYVKETERLLLHSNLRPSQLINAGVSGYHFEHYNLFIKDNVNKFHPDHIIVGFCINDIRPRDVVRQRYIVRATHRLPLDSMIKHNVKRIIKKSPSFQLFSHLIFSTKYKRQNYNAMWITQVNMSWQNEILLRKLEDMFKEVSHFTKEKGIRFSIIIFPEMNQLIDPKKYSASRDSLLRFLNDLDIDHLDLYDTFGKKEDFSKYYLKGDSVHFTVEGHRIIAEELKKFLVENYF